MAARRQEGDAPQLTQVSTQSEGDLSTGRGQAWSHEGRGVGGGAYSGKVGKREAGEGPSLNGGPRKDLVNDYLRV